MTGRMVVFGGTFDPIHHGHLIVARSLAETCGFRRITLVPAASPPHKTAACAAAEDRLAMLHLAADADELFEIADLELRRSGPSYSFDTLQQLRRRCGQQVTVHWVIGADMLEDLPTWHRAEEVLEMAELLVVARPPWHRQLDAVFARLSKHFSRQQIDRLRAGVRSTPLIEISSSQIRQRVAAGQSIRYLVPGSVMDYIRERRLYAAQGKPAAGGGSQKNAKNRPQGA